MNQTDLCSGIQKNIAWFVDSVSATNVCGNYRQKCSMIFFKCCYSRSDRITPMRKQMMEVLILFSDIEKNIAWFVDSVSAKNVCGNYRQKCSLIFFKCCYSRSDRITPMRKRMMEVLILFSGIEKNIAWFVDSVLATNVRGNYRQKCSLIFVKCCYSRSETTLFSLAVLILSSTPIAANRGHKSGQ